MKSLTITALLLLIALSWAQVEVDVPNNGDDATITVDDDENGELGNWEEENNWNENDEWTKWEEVISLTTDPALIATAGGALTAAATAVRDAGNAINGAIPTVPADQQPLYTTNGQNLLGAADGLDAAANSVNYLATLPAGTVTTGPLEQSNGAVTAAQNALREAQNELPTVGASQNLIDGVNNAFGVVNDAGNQENTNLTPTLQKGIHGNSAKLHRINLAVNVMNGEIILASLPDDVVFTVIGSDPVPKVKNQSWYARASRPGRIVIKENDDFEVKVHEEFAILTIGTTSWYDDGIPPIRPVIRFKISTKDGKYSKTGYFVYTTTEWGGSFIHFSRPDYALVTFGFDNEIPNTVISKVPTLQTNPPFYIHIEKGENEFVIGVSNEKSLTMRFAEIFIEGILMAHRYGVSWAVGKFF